MAEEGTAAGGVMDIDQSLKEMLKISFIQGGLACGTQSCQALRQALNPSLCTGIRTNLSTSS